MLQDLTQVLWCCGLLKKGFGALACAASVSTVLLIPESRQIQQKSNGKTFSSLPALFFFLFKPNPTPPRPASYAPIQPGCHGP